MVKSDTHAHKSQRTQTNWLRAAVLGANDGIVSIAALIVGVAGTTTNKDILLITGIAGIVAGALSMAVGEYVSVSSQLDTEKFLLERERLELHHNPEEEYEELISLYEKRGLKRKTAELVAHELTENDAFLAHVEAELKIDPDSLTNPWHAAYASGTSFTMGSAIPFAAVLLSPTRYAVYITFFASIIALIVTGIISGKLSGASIPKATFRVVTGGALAMVITFGIGSFIGTSVL